MCTGIVDLGGGHVGGVGITNNRFPHVDTCSLVVPLMTTIAATGK
jgi:hypothetical protein